MQELIKKYEATRAKLKAMRFFGAMTSWDMQTEAPAKSFAGTSAHLALLSELNYKTVTDPEYVEVVEQLNANKDKLDPVLAHEIEVVAKDIADTKKVPMEESLAFSKLTNEGYPKYVEAKTTNNFQLFLPILSKVVEHNRKLTKYLATDTKQGYNVLLDMYEPNFPQAKYDEFFGVLRDKLVPFVKKVTAKKLSYNDSFVGKVFPADKQEQFSQYLMDAIGLDKQACVLKVSEHPFTMGVSKNNVRLTTHYYETEPTFAMFSTVHEGGHALYEQNFADELDCTFSADGASMGIHESQSRFFENLVGRSLPFWQAHFPKLKEIFPEQLEGVTVEDWYKHVNKSECSFIRTEADELTYPLHIMLRYEMEKNFIEGDLAPEDFATYWNKTFTEYFGITPPTDTLGVLQDVHWAYGNVGYFPTYALGSAISSQLYAHMAKDIDIEACLAEGHTKPINAWLKEKVHIHGSTKYPTDILRDAIGEDFDPNYYVEYLISKYSKLYDIK